MAVPGWIEPPFAGWKPAVLTDRRRDREGSFILKLWIIQDLLRSYKIKSLIFKLIDFLLFQKFSYIWPIILILFLLLNKCSSIFVLKQLKHIALIDDPIFGFIITDICLFFTIWDLIILTFLIKKIGEKLKFPNGHNLFISDRKSVV